MYNGLVLVTCSQNSGQDPIDVAKKCFNGDVPGSEAHQIYHLTRGPGSTLLEDPIVMSAYQVRDPQNLAQIVEKSGFTNIRVYELFRSWGSVEELPAPGQITAAVSLSPPKELVKECDEWYETEHVDLLSKTPGWISSLRYKLLIGSAPAYLAMHNYLLKPGQSLSEIDEFKAAVDTDLTRKIISACRENPNFGYERYEWDYQCTIPIYPENLEEKLRKFVVDFYNTSDKPGAHDEYISNLTEDACVVFNGTASRGHGEIYKLRQQMWTSIIKRHHRADRVFASTRDELGIYGSAYFTAADGNILKSFFWARMKFQDPDAKDLKLTFYEVNKRLPIAN